MLSNNKLNVAMIHDWFSGEFSGGAEKVLRFLISEIDSLTKSIFGRIYIKTVSIV